MAYMLGHILKNVGVGGGLLAGIGEALLDHGARQTPEQMQQGRQPADAPSYKQGSDNVPQSGPAILHKGEAVLNRHDAAAYRSAKSSIFNGAAEHMAGADKKPPKEIREVRTRKAKSGGYIHEHHHTHPEHHPMEEHTSPDQDAMIGHMMEHMGEPNPGEMEADAGQAGGAMPTAQPMPGM